MNEEKFLVALIRSCVKDEQINLTTENLDKRAFLRLVSKHNLQVIAYTGLKKNNIYDEKFSVLKKQVYSLLTYASVQQQETEKLLKLLDENGIACVPLKGYHVKCLYPSSEMRFLSDFDCLVKKSDYKKVKSILKGSDFSCDSETIKHLECHSSSGGLFEIHSRLYDRFIDAEFEASLFNEEIADGYNCVYKSGREKQYVIVLAHLASHFLGGGIGVRNLIDLYLLNKQNLDRETLEEMLVKYKLKKFDEKTVKACRVLFDDEESDEFTDEFIDYSFNSFPYGDEKGKDLTDLARSYNGDIKSAQKGTLWKKIYPPYESMKGIYPFLEKKKWLLPFAHIRRHFAIIFKRRYQLKKFKSISDFKEEDVIKVKKLLEGLEI